MIGEDYTSKAVRAVLGAGHSELIPENLWGGWLDASLDVLGYSGIRVPHETFGAVDGGVANLDAVDGGLAGDSWAIAWFGLFDAESDGNLVIAAAVTATPGEGDPLIFDAGDLTFTYGEPA
jgi:hypothetical protein